MRVTIKIDSAEAVEVEEFLRSFQQTPQEGEPRQIGTEPTVRIIGRGWEVTTPAMSACRAAMLVHNIMGSWMGSRPAYSQQQLLSAAYGLLGDGVGDEWGGPDTNEYTRAICELLADLLGPDLDGEGDDRKYAASELIRKHGRP